MSDKLSDKLDNWLSKNVSHQTDGAAKPMAFSQTNKPENPKGFFNRGKNQDQKRKPFWEKGKLKIIPLGGLNQVGQNMAAIEYGNDIIVIDMGLQFPEEDMLGVDYVLPDFTYIQKNRHKLRGILITHGHLDHIGAIPWVSPKLDNPNFYGTRLTMGLVRERLDEFGLLGQSKLNTIHPDETLRLGVFKISFFRVNHSIPDCVGIIIETPVGIVVHTGDFKFDFTPADGVLADFNKIADLGRKNVLVMLSDSTNATKPGHTTSEAVVGEVLDQIIGEAPKRIIVAAFASVIGRMQQIFDSAAKHNRKIYISGRSMIKNIEIANELGFLKFKKDLIKEMRRNSKGASSDDALILTTGSQGESLAGLTRMAMDEHQDVRLRKSDTVVFSSSPIRGNERAVIAVINELSRKGINVINNQLMDVHTSGHGQQEDLKLMLGLVKPQYFIPVHGEYYMRKAHGELAKEMGIPESNIILADNGYIIEASKNKVELAKEKIETRYILVDGKGLGDSSAHVLSERQSMAQNGVLVISVLLDKKGFVVGKPEIQSHGFIYMGEEEKIMKELNKATLSALKLATSKQRSRKEVENYLKSYLDSVCNDLIERRPLIVPTVHFV